MKIKKLVLVSAFFPPSIGGPATFVSNIGPEFVKMGYEVLYVNLEPYKNTSKLKRYFLFLRDLWKSCKNADLVFISDTWSVLIPSVFVCFLRRKKYLIRIGGDFLWETYVERTKEQLKLSLFYSVPRRLSLKEKIIFFLTRRCIEAADVVVFNTSWQRSIWELPYGLKKNKAQVVENALVTGIMPYMGAISKQRVLRCPVRASEFKNVEMLKNVWGAISEKYPDTVLLFEYIHPNERARILSETYAVIQPSISDVAPNLMCEAVASGCPFICTQDTGIKSLLPLDIGLYIDTTNEESMHESLEMILEAKVHDDLVEKIKGFKITRTYDVLAKEYQDIWNTL